MSESNGYAKKEDLFASPFRRDYADHEQTFNGAVRKFRIQTLNDAEKGEHDGEAVNSKGRFRRESVATANARLIALCCVDGDGQRIFSRSDVATLQQYDSAEVEQLAAACRRHCGWEEEPEKNLAATDDDDSLSS